MNDDADKRTHPRYDVQDVRGTLLFSMDARVVNISLDGMAVETSTWLQLGRRYAVKVPHANASLSLPGEVRWSRLVRTERTPRGEIAPIYRAGLHFDDVLTETAQKLLSFLEENAVIRLEKRLFGRFKIATDCEVNLDSEIEFVVRRISLSGMLIETDMAPEVDSRFEMEVRFDGGALEMVGRVVNVREASTDTGEKVVQAGIEFVDMRAEERARLEDFIRTQLG